MKESQIVNIVVKSLKDNGFRVATEVPNLYRSADVAAIDSEENIWVIECKISSISKAIEQLQTHKLSADKVFIGTIFRKTRENTIKKIKQAGVGLIYIMPDSSVNIAFGNTIKINPWNISKEKLRKRILEVKNGTTYLSL